MLNKKDLVRDLNYLMPKYVESPSAPVEEGRYSRLSLLMKKKS